VSPMGRPAIITREPVALPEHELLARIFRTLGDPTRLRMVEALGQLGEATQSQLIDEVGATQSRASEHLATLTWCGFVERRRDGRSVRYSLTEQYASELIRQARRFLQTGEHAVGGCTVAAEDPPPTAAAGFMAPAPV
jgi:ArsR family transcriptional regulator, cadmium/lead-responsive transcriptional repressor